MLCAYSLTHTDIYSVAPLTFIEPFFDPPQVFFLDEGLHKYAPAGLATPLYGCTLFNLHS